ncbi:hypothetical protein [Cryptosporangium minutisporangium]|uniref:Secreted protein n=1 Tax=Cryptosporangium minutisporangium TaxID=113569 RepID=A0ABP6SPF4_9ACTN
MTAAQETQAVGRCPDDTDDVHWVAPADRSEQIACVRRLAAPHPGDPGGGQGQLVTGDCVSVIRANSTTAPNDRIVETPCATKGWFATVTGVVRGTPASDPPCPAGTLSRVLHPVKTGMVACLGQGDGGNIAGPGECLKSLKDAWVPIERVDCGTQTFMFKVVGFAGADGTCEDGDPVALGGYDRRLCGYGWYGGERSDYY